MATTPLHSEFPGVALITGAGGTGIGAVTAQAFARAGCRRIAITDINSVTLEATRQKILAIEPKADVLTAVGDIADDDFAQSFASVAVDRFQRIDYAVNCAGTLNNKSTKSTDMSVSEFDKITGVNYKGCWLSSRAELGIMSRQKPLSEAGTHRGALVNIASQLGVVARPGAAAYCASKAAIINMTRADAIDFAPDGVRVNCVCPGVIDTPMTMEDPELKASIEKVCKKTPSGRIGRPEEVADAILFLCSDRASFIQGHALVVDGGYTIQ